MAGSQRRLVAPGGFDADEGDFDLLPLGSLTGGEPRDGQWTGTKALMVAVLQDGIRSYLGSAPVNADEAKCWIQSTRRHSPFSFVVVCEVLGLEPSAVRQAVRRMKADRVAPHTALPRARRNARMPAQMK